MRARGVVALVLLLYWLRTMELKAGVVLALSPEMARALHVIEDVHKRVVVFRGAIVTSARDGVHRDGSHHYTGNAVDLRTRDLVGSVRVALARELARSLGRDFDVVDEGDHIHVEYDPD